MEDFTYEVVSAGASLTPMRLALLAPLKKREACLSVLCMGAVDGNMYAHRITEEEAQAVLKDPSGWSESERKIGSGRRWSDLLIGAGLERKTFALLRPVRFVIPVPNYTTDRKQFVSLVEEDIRKDEVSLSRIRDLAAQLDKFERAFRDEHGVWGYSPALDAQMSHDSEWLRLRHDLLCSVMEGARLAAVYEQTLARRTLDQAPRAELVYIDVALCAINDIITEAKPWLEQ